MAPSRHALLGADQWVLAAFRRAGVRWSGVGRAARRLSLAGEHAALWVAAGLVGAAVDPARRQEWLRATAVTCAAHLASSAAKQAIRRPRPVSTQGTAPAPATAPTSGAPPASGPRPVGISGAAPSTPPPPGPHSVGGTPPPPGRRQVGTLGRYSFPSSHAASSVAAAVAFGAVRVGAGRVAGPVAAAMCVARLVTGVHYPTDVAAGALLGAVVARWTPYRHFHRHG
ncbi:phosphatase PAP2 family protein [Streptomyces sp. NPDC046887]|uniref:phosphatase PAP2 family protein n=1 Tax=Streptomyces sp. NPDC046887 TaxID=3155472 RepID=UPI0033F52387